MLHWPLQLSLLGLHVAPLPPPTRPPPPTHPPPARPPWPRPPALCHHPPLATDPSNLSSMSIACCTGPSSSTCTRHTLCNMHIPSIIIYIQASAAFGCAVLQSVQMCVTCHCVALQGSYKCSARRPQHHGHRNGCGAAKIQGFGKGDLVECRREDSLICWAEVKSAPSSAIRCRSPE